MRSTVTQEEFKMTTKTYPKVINYLEYNHQENKGEKNTLESETVPNQAFTVKEVLLRYNNGTLPNIVQPVFYDDTDDFDNIDPTQNPAFDLVDAENILKQINNNKKEREELKNQQNSPELKAKIENKNEQKHDETKNDEKSE